VVWGDRLFVTSAVSSRGEATFRPGLYGDGDASDDRTAQRWTVAALDTMTGSVLWERTAYEGEPREKRHIKSTYASSSPATDGRYVVAFFGSQGLYVYTVEGMLVWSVDLGRLDVGAYDLPSYEWGPASSPVLWNDRVIVQCDTQADSFVAAFDLATGRELWRTMRDELPSWGTPTVVESSLRVEVVTNGSNFIRSYDPDDGSELWRLGGSSKITAPTPIFDGGLIIVASGRAPERPIFAVRPSATGDISLAGGRTSNDSVAWSWVRRGSYMPTPLAYGGRLYLLSNQGVFDSYDLESGREIYRERIAHGGSGFSASPVAADGRIYLSSEDGQVFVIAAGAEPEVIAENDLGEPIMATPAIVGQTLYVRARDHLWAISKSE
jgi:outer membrane protein assembly factor BamB